MSELNLKPCPMCGSADVEFCEDTASDHRELWAHDVECNACGASSRWERTREAAAAAWNRRVTPAEPLGALPPLPAQPEELRARWKCEDCDGRGHDGEMHDQGYWQPPEPGRCGTCEGAGWVETAALLPEQAEEYARHAIAADRAQQAAADQHAEGKQV